MIPFEKIGIFKIPEKLVVIGDIHADYDTLLKTLRYSGLINKKIEWTGRKTHLLIIGDLVDGKSRVGEWKNDSDLKVIYLLDKLMTLSEKKGGKVIILLGNHEFMNMAGNFSYSGKRSTKEMGGENERLKYFTGDFIEFAKKCYLVVKYGDWIINREQFYMAPGTSEILNENVYDLNIIDKNYNDLTKFFTTENEIRSFQNEMRSGKADWQMIYYANAVHSFTDKNAGNDNSKGVAYNEKADKRSWNAMLDFLKEVL